MWRWRTAIMLTLSAALASTVEPAQAQSTPQTSPGILSWKGDISAATLRLVLTNRRTYAGSTLRVQSVLTYHGQLRGVLCLPGNLGCGVVAPTNGPEQRKDYQLAGQRAFLGTAQDVRQYNRSAVTSQGYDPGPHQKKRLGIPIGTQTIERIVRNVGTKSPNFQDVYFTIIVRANLLYKIPKDTPAGRYYLGVINYPSDTISICGGDNRCRPGNPYRLGPYERPGWWQSGQLPLITVGAVAPTAPPVTPKPTPGIDPASALFDDLLHLGTRDPRFAGVPAQARSFAFTPRPGAGLIRTCWFIADPSPGLGPWQLQLSGMGDGRGFDEKFDPERCRVAVYLNFENGRGALRENPSCGKPGRGCITPDRLSFRATDSPDGLLLDYNYHTAKRQLFVLPAPGISGRMRFSYQPTVQLGGRSVQLEATVDSYPSIEVYRDVPGSSPECIYRRRENGIRQLFGHLPRGSLKPVTGVGC